MELNEIWENFKSNKKAQIITIVVLIILIGASIGGIMLFNDKTIISNVNNTNVKINNDSIPLPLAIMIENYKDVRPQYSLGEADIVYEALAEGGITRFLAIYTISKNLETIGPVRSARHYYVDIAEEYHGLFAHIGGSPEALGILSVQEYLSDLNQFGYSQYYWRDEEKAAPHNLFTSTNLLAYAVRDLNLSPEGDYESWKYGKSNKNSVNDIVNQLIKIDFSTDDYNVEWKYDNDKNSFLRYNGGVEHKDALTDKQIEAKNIIVQYTETSLMDQATGRLDIQTQGEGRAVVFVDSTAIDATWKKLNRGDRTKFYDKEGQEITLNNGITWVEIVATDTIVEWN
jgi:hypothetical protein